MNVLIIIFVIGLFLMGPIAFIWCYYLSSQIDELKEQKDRLEFMLQQKLFSQTKKAAAPFSATEKVKEAETTETTENILTAIQKAKEQTTEQYLSPTNDLETINDPALRTAIQWAQAVPFKPVTNNPVTNKFVSKIETPPVLSEPNPESLHPVTPSPTAAIPTTAAAPTVTESTPISESTPQVKKSQTDEEWETIYPAIPSKDGNIVWQSVELWIGRKLLGWVAVLGFIVSAALFIRHAVQSGWIGPELKVLGIAVFGMVFLGAGKYFWNNGWQRFSKMLSSTGIIVLFQAGYASFAFYKLISVSTAGVVMSLIILGSFLLSWCYTSRLLGIISILGGLAVPILLSTNTDSYTELFTYLIILNIGTVILVNLLRRSPIGFLAFWGTQIEFWLWYLRYYYTLDSIPLEKLGAVLIFQGMFYLVYLVDTTIAAIVPRVHTLPTWDDVMRAILSPIIFFGTIWQLLHNDLTFGSWLGVTAFIGAAWYSLLAVLYSRHLARTWNTNIEQKLLLYWKAAPAAATVIALGFIAIGIPLHFDAAWQALGWVTVFAGLWYFGHRQENKTFRVMAFVFITLGVLRLLFDIFDPITSDYFVPLSTRLPFFSLAELPSFTAIFIVIFITIITHRFLAAENKQSYIPSNFWTGLSGYGFMILFLSVELVQYFILRQKLYIPCYSWASILLTLLWIFGVLLLYEIGFVFHSSALQNISLFAFFIIIIKMFIDFFSRGFFSEPIWNPFCPVIIVSSLILIAVGVQYRQNKELTDNRIEAGILGIAGIFLLLGVLSVECYQFFLRYPSLLPVPLEAINDSINSIIALGTLSILWTGYALVLFVLGILF
ncbi:MAG: DUF2339 domain-containing protein, partial [Planctomycetaceae bacterium]|nr:DUF2339 domain-containing protein [Planctomycetaceae bacterium]